MKEKNISALEAGISDDDTTWLNSKSGILEFENYLAIISMMVDDMDQELGTRLDRSRFETEMGNIVRKITKESKPGGKRGSSGANSRKVTSGSCLPRQNASEVEITQPILRAKRVSSMKQTSIPIDLLTIQQVQLHNNYLVIVTEQRVLGFIPRNAYQYYTQKTAKKSVLQAMKAKHLEYVLFFYNYTIASVKKIIQYADKNNLLIDDREEKALMTNYLLGKRSNN